MSCWRLEGDELVAAALAELTALDRQYTAGKALKGAALEALSRSGPTGEVRRTWPQRRQYRTDAAVLRWVWIAAAFLVGGLALVGTAALLGLLS